ncbi:hypothetical protein CYMTET_39969 [Cymbomonas tetramitiformis]|uniref:Alpha-(1,6)-fucosyltransferase N- and catalytic domain-containing protein n=1 Tax=Cymbomonas tetramitiformis TaxID=36881 RepID=A0AAE0CA14_9CHLO|nr:hypothetical protein CYMTET_39969 [Cymbomonas tetramitiformis]
MRNAAICLLTSDRHATKRGAKNRSVGYEWWNRVAVFNLLFLLPFSAVQGFKAHQEISQRVHRFTFQSYHRCQVDGLPNLQEDLEYIPSSRQLTEYSLKCVHLEKLYTQHAQREIRLQQSQANRAEAFGRHVSKFGFAYNFAYMVMKFAQAIDKRVAFVYVNESLGRYSGQACLPFNNTYECFFNSPAKTANLPITEVIYGPKDLKSTRFSIRVPKEYQELGYFWYHAQLLRVLWDPNHKMLARIARAKREIGLSRNLTSYNMIGMHVRHGDSCYARKQTKRCPPFEEYLKHARSFRDKYNVSSIYLATDDAELAQRVRASKHIIDGFSFYMQSFIDDNSVVQRALIKYEDEPAQFTIGALKIGDNATDNSEAAARLIIDLTLLSTSEFFIGTFTSNIGRLAYELMYIEKGYRPYISLDIAWCSRWGSKLPRRYRDAKPAPVLVAC